MQKEYKDLVIKSFEISALRGINELSVNNLSNINIFVGANNSGKTSVLEALKLFAAPNDIGQIVQVALQRIQVSKAWKTMNLASYVSTLFQKNNEDDGSQNFQISIKAEINSHWYAYDIYGALSKSVNSSGGAQNSFDISSKVAIDNRKPSYNNTKIVSGAEHIFTPYNVPLFNSLYIHSNTHYYYSCSRLISEKILEKKSELLEILNAFDSTVNDISVIGEDVYLYSASKGSLPLFSYGMGMQKAVLLTAALMECKNGIILIDEIDNAINISAFEKVFKWFIDSCLKYNVQSFITTHSIEAVDAMLRVVKNDYSELDAMRVITLRKLNDNKTKCLVRDATEAYNDRLNFKMELRV